jgi:hypothetical protein
VILRSTKFSGSFLASVQVSLRSALAWSSGNDAEAATARSALPLFVK